MAGAGKKWAIGCGIGCIAILLVLVALGVAGGMFVRNTMRGFADAVEARSALEERFGGVAEFTPRPDGVIPPERIEAFLAVRASTAGARRALAEKFSGIPMSESEARELDAKPVGEKARSILGIIGSAVGIGAEMGHFFDARNRALLEHEMGLGEYTYLYSLCYYVFLRHSPDDGPASERDTDGRVHIGEASTSRRIHAALLSMLRNQMRELPSDAPELRAALAREVEAMKGDRDRYPWMDGLPPATAASLEPFRDRLDTSYDPASNPFELAINKKQGRLGFTAE